MKKIFTILGLLALMLTSCSPYQLVNSEVYNDADLSQYHTFRIVTPDMGKLPPGMEMVTYYNIAAAIRQEMLMRGFEESSTSPLLVNIAVTTHREIETSPLVPPGGYFPYNGPYYPYYMWPRYNYGPYWDPAYYSNAQVITGIYKEGVLTMDLVNIDTKVPLFGLCRHHPQWWRQRLPGTLRHLRGRHHPLQQIPRASPSAVPHQEVINPFEVITPFNKT